MRLPAGWWFCRVATTWALWKLFRPCWQFSIELWGRACSLHSMVSPDATLRASCPCNHIRGSYRGLALASLWHGGKERCVHAGDFLARRCKDLLDSSPSTYEQAAEALQNTVDGSALAISLRYAMRRKDILHRGAFGGIAASKLTRC